MFIKVWLSTATVGSLVLSLAESLERFSYLMFSPPRRVALPLSPSPYFTHYFSDLLREFLMLYKGLEFSPSLLLGR